jgi:hypothetical protein
VRHECSLREAARTVAQLQTDVAMPHDAPWDVHDLRRRTNDAMVIMCPSGLHPGLAATSRSAQRLPLHNPRRPDELHVTLRAVTQDPHDRLWQRQISAALNFLEWEVAVVRDDDPSTEQRTS